MNLARNTETLRYGYVVLAECKMTPIADETEVNWFQLLQNE
jgi:hypothetical protein